MTLGGQRHPHAPHPHLCIPTAVQVGNGERNGAGGPGCSVTRQPEEPAQQRSIQRPLCVFSPRLTCPTRAAARWGSESLLRKDVIYLFLERGEGREARPESSREGTAGRGSLPPPSFQKWNSRDGAGGGYPKADNPGGRRSVWWQQAHQRVTRPVLAELWLPQPRVSMWLSLC